MSGLDRENARYIASKYRANELEFARLLGDYIIAWRKFVERSMCEYFDEVTVTEGALKYEYIATFYDTTDYTIHTPQDIHRIPFDIFNWYTDYHGVAGPIRNYLKKHYPEFV